MSQNKTIAEIQEKVNGEGRIQTRRSSRSTRSASPVMEEMEPSSPDSSPEPRERATRSPSVDSSGYETTDSRKRKKKSKNTPNKKRADSYQPTTKLSIFKDESERETRYSTQRMSKEAREAKKAQRDVLIKEKLTELDKLEKSVKDGSHIEYHKLLQDIETKKSKMLTIIEMRRSLAECNINNFFNSQKDNAYSQYYWDKLALRRSMIQNVQHKINTIEQEYYSNNQVQTSLDDEHLTDWAPPDRPSMISSLTLGLNEEDAEHDLEWAKQDPHETASIAEDSVYASYKYPSRHDNNSPPSLSQPPTRSQAKEASHEASPPLDMLASLADCQYQKDFKEELDKSEITLPPLNSWRYERPPLPT